MFHVKQRLRSLRPLLLLASLFVLACSGAPGARGWAEPVRSDDQLIVSTDHGKLEAIDAETGAVRWRFPDFWQIDKSAEDLEGIYAPPVIGRSADEDAVDVIFVGDYNGYLYIFRPAEQPTSEFGPIPPAASIDLDGRVIGGLALDEAQETLFVTAGDRLIALKTADLFELAVDADLSFFQRFAPFEAGDAIWSPPTLAAGKVFVASLDGNLYAIDAATGRELWRFAANGGLLSRPVVADATLLVGGLGSRLYALDTANGDERWSFAASNWVWSRPLVVDGNVYFADFDGNVHALSLASGAPLWPPFATGGRIRAGVALVGDSLVVATEDGMLFGVDSRTGAGPAGRPLWGIDVNTAVGDDVGSILADLVVDGDSVIVLTSRCAEVTLLDQTRRKINYLRVDPLTGVLDSVRAPDGC